MDPLRALLLLVGMAFAGCATLPTNLETPEVSFVSLRAVEASVFEQRLEVRMKVRNPNDVELPVNGPTSTSNWRTSRSHAAFRRESSSCPPVARPSSTCS
jgi:hypothetical protein